MLVKFVSMEYRSSTTDDEIQTKLNGICNTLEKNGYEVCSTQFAFDGRHVKLLFWINYK